MSFDELLPTLKELDRADKLRAMQFLVIEPTREEGVLLDAGATYPVWSPFKAFDAANALLDALRTKNDNA